MNVVAHESVKSLVVEAVVTRCGCTAEQKAAQDWHARMGEKCPRPIRVDDLGAIVRWHKNPLRQAWNNVRRLFGKV